MGLERTDLDIVGVSASRTVTATADGTDVRLEVVHDVKTILSGPDDLRSRLATHGTDPANAWGIFPEPTPPVLIRRSADAHGRLTCVSRGQFRFCDRIVDAVGRDWGTVWSWDRGSESMCLLRDARGVTRSSEGRVINGGSSLPDLVRFSLDFRRLHPVRWMQSTE